MKKRAFTEQQAKLLRMRKVGATTDAIAQALGVHVATVSAKERAIKRGVNRRAYLVPPELEFIQQPDLFDEGIYHAS
jgi:DNA-binding CsgD family transcriptional regulator